jgi:hypothetical protein
MSRRRARSHGSATRKILRSAPGKTTVPMSRPSTTTSWPTAASRTRAFTQSRTGGIAATPDTWRVTSVPRISSPKARPPRTGAKVLPSGASVTSVEAASTRAGVQSSSGTPSAIAAKVAARYSAPESMWRKPSRSATQAAVDDLPDAAGPSMAMIILRGTREAGGGRWGAR